MPLDDEDREWIADQIKSASQPPPGRRQPAASRVGGDPGGAARGGYDMSDRDVRETVRSEVEQALAAMDAEAERTELRQRVKELEAEKAERAKGGKKAPAAKPDDGTEKPPTLLSRGYQFLFGDVKPGS